MPPRRKQKPPEYEDDPVFTPPKVMVEPPVTVKVEPTGSKVIPEKPDGVLPVVGDNTVKHRGFDEIWVRTADKYRKPPVITPPKVPINTPESDSKPVVSSPKVTNIERKVTEPTDEVVEGWGKVIGHKEKKVKTT